MVALYATAGEVPADQKTRRARRGDVRYRQNMQELKYKWNKTQIQIQKTREARRVDVRYGRNIQAVRYQQQPTHRRNLVTKLSC